MCAVELHSICFRDYGRVRVPPWTTLGWRPCSELTASFEDGTACPPPWLVARARGAASDPRLVQAFRGTGARLCESPCFGLPAAAVVICRVIRRSGARWAADRYSDLRPVHVPGAVPGAALWGAKGWGVMVTVDREVILSYRACTGVSGRVRQSRLSGHPTTGTRKASTPWHGTLKDQRHGGGVGGPPAIAIGAVGPPELADGLNNLDKLKYVGHFLIQDGHWKSARWVYTDGLVWDSTGATVTADRTPKHGDS